jgi:hypothetical protein
MSDESVDWNAAAEELGRLLVPSETQLGRTPAPEEPK